MLGLGRSKVNKFKLAGGAGGLCEQIDRQTGTTKTLPYRKLRIKYKNIL